MILVTTCRKPCKNTRKFAKMLALVIPNSTYEVRGKKNIYSLIDIARNKGLRRLAIITDLKGNPGKIEFLKITKKEWNFDKTMNIKALSGKGIKTEEIKVEGELKQQILDLFDIEQTPDADLVLNAEKDTILFKNKGKNILKIKIGGI